MSKLKPILNKQDKIIGYMFYCPGCKSYHAPYIDPYSNNLNAAWTFNGDLEKPTFNPSVLSKAGSLRCHLFVWDGILEFLPDCTHELAGKKVAMLDVE